jgi:3-phenylpropionate/cinnamic acid dioxygenase small subunit
MTPTESDLVRFVYRESRLIDEKRFDEWYALYADDAFYWIPLVRDQPDGDNHTSLMYEDKLLLRLRIERFSNARSYSLHPEVRCLHVLQQPEVTMLEPQANRFVVRTNLVYLETQGERQIVLGVVATHTLSIIDDALRIRLKRVDLLNCDAPLPSIQLFP